MKKPREKLTLGHCSDHLDQLIARGVVHLRRFHLLQRLGQKLFVVLRQQDYQAPDFLDVLLLDSLSQLLLNR